MGEAFGIHENAGKNKFQARRTTAKPTPTGGLFHWCAECSRDAMLTGQAPRKTTT